MSITLYATGHPDYLIDNAMTVQLWLSGQVSSGMTECPMIKDYMSVIDNGGTVEETERAYWGKIKQNDNL